MSVRLVVDNKPKQKFWVLVQAPFGDRYVMDQEGKSVLLVVDPKRTPSLEEEEATALLCKLRKLGHNGTLVPVTDE